MKHWETEIFEYGYREGRLVHVLDVANGLNCGCCCPSCDERLVAVNRIKGRKPRPYFRHYSRDSCSFQEYRETVTHYQAKQIIEEVGYLVVPKVSLHLTHIYHDYWTDLEPEELPMLGQLPKCISYEAEKVELHFDRIVIEKKEGSIRPDIKVFVSSNSGLEKMLIVEIAYSHFVDEDKLQKIRNQKIDVIEIDLSDLSKNATGISIHDQIYSNTNCVSWLNNEKLNASIRNKLQQALDVRSFMMDQSMQLKTYANLKKVYKCPLKKQRVGVDYVSVDGQCRSCNYFVEMFEETNTSLELYKYEKDEMEALGEDTEYLLDKYGQEIHYKHGQLLCCGNLKQKLSDMVLAANLSPVNPFG
jgi:hypothetical protein